MSYELSTKTYQGPIEKLLELIEDKKLDITTVSLAEVTADFLVYFETLEKQVQEGEKIEPNILADFVTVASKLLLIKSKSILPSLELSEEEEGDIRDLEARLVFYKQIKETHSLIMEKWRESPQMLSREFMGNTEPLFYPPRTLTANDLLIMVQKITGELERLFKPTATMKAEIINVKARIEEVLQRLTEVPISMRSLQTRGGKRELVVLFLAVLHLIRQQFADVEQDEHFGDIRLVKRVAQ